MSPHQQVILGKLAVAWDYAPTARLGQLLESIENVGWELSDQRSFPNRTYAPRLLWMPDQLIEAALDRWNEDENARKVVGV